VKPLLCVLTLLLLAAPADAEDDNIFVPEAPPPQSGPVDPAPKPEPKKPAPAASSRLVGTWHFDGKGKITCGDGTMVFSSTASGKLSGRSQTGQTKPTTDFQRIEVSGDSVTITYGYIDLFNDAQTKTLRGLFDPGDDSIRGSQSGNAAIEGCTFVMKRQ